MTETFDIILVALNQLVVQVVNVFPKIIISIVIWYVGKYLIHLSVKMAKKINIKRTEIDNKIIDTLTSVILIAGKIILILIILDYWNIGETIINALVSGLTYTFAIAFGLAFGKALEPEAKTLVENFKEKIEK